MIGGLSSLGLGGGGQGLGGLMAPTSATAGDVNQQGASIGSGLTCGGAGDRVGLVLNIASRSRQDNAGINPISTPIPQSTLLIGLAGFLVFGFIALQLFKR
jgi:hypothetical protein